jgi:hypothetical protein
VHWLLWWACKPTKSSSWAPKGAFEGLTATKQAVRDSTRNDSAVDLSYASMEANGQHTSR